MTNEVEKGRAGQFFDDFLREQGTWEETTERAVKRVLAFQFAAAVRAQKITKSLLEKS